MAHETIIKGSRGGGKTEDATREVARWWSDQAKKPGITVEYKAQCESHADHYLRLAGAPQLSLGSAEAD